MRILFTLGVLALLSACATSAEVISSGSGPSLEAARSAPAHGVQRRIAVAGFETRSATASRDVGRGMSDMLVDALFNSGRFIVLERERLDDVRAEQELASGKDFRQDTAPQAGQLEGAEWLIRAAITEFEPNCKGGSAVLVSGKQACIGLNVRIVEVATGRVLNATTVSATSASNRVGLIFATGSMPIGLGAYSKTPMEGAIRNAIETAVQHIASTKI